jgi:hypothetical protein
VFGICAVTLALFKRKLVHFLLAIPSERKVVGTFLRDQFQGGAQSSLQIGIVSTVLNCCVSGLASRDFCALKKKAEHFLPDALRANALEQLIVALTMSLKKKDSNRGAARAKNLRVRTVSN